MTREFHRLCAHEAAHAVVALVAGLGVHQVCVNPEGGGGQMTQKHRPRTDLDAMLHMAVRVAGMAGEQLLDIHPDKDGQTRDMQGFRGALAKSSWSGLPWDTVLKAFLSMATQILQANRPLFEAVRSELATAHQLSSTEVWELALPHLPLQRPWGDDWQAALTHAYRGGYHVVP